MVTLSNKQYSSEQCLCSNDITGRKFTVITTHRYPDLLHAVPLPEGGAVRFSQGIKVHGDAIRNGD